MRVLDAIVIPQFAESMAIIESGLAQSRSVRFESVRDEAVWLDMLIAQLPPQQSQCCSSVAAFLYDHFYHVAFVVDRAPQEHAFAADRADHFIEAPARRGRLFPTSKVRCDL